MQGPVDETDYDNWTNTVSSSQAGKGFGRSSMSRKVHMRAESGTCNLCSAPCSSCMHVNQTLMGSKVDESPDETCHRDATSQYSINEGESFPPLKSRACDNLQHTGSETSNIFSVTSSHDSFSENVESKANMRSSDISYASEGVEMCPKSKSLDTSDQGALSDKFEDARGIEGHDDNISCVSGPNDANIGVNCDNMSVDRNYILCSSASVRSLGPVELGNSINFETRSSNLDLNFNEESLSNVRRQSRYLGDSEQKGPSTDLLAVQVSNKFDSSKVHASRDTDAGSSSPKVPSPYPHSGSRKSPTENLDLKDLEEDLSSHSQRKPPDCSIEQMDISLTKEAASNILSGQKSEHADIFQNFKGSHIGRSSDVLVKIYPNPEADTDKDSGDLRNEALRCSGQNEQAKKSKDQIELHDMSERPLQSESGDSDIVEHDVKVCDICGDAGREDLLAVCSRCSDGAEHTYCMREMREKVPEDEWLCEECKFNKETEKQNQDKVEIVDENEKKQFSGCTNTVPTDLFVNLDTKDSDEGNRTNKASPIAQVSRKRPADHLDAAPAAKVQAHETSTSSPKVSSPSRTAALSRDSSFKNLDKGKIKLTHQMSFSPYTTGPRLQSDRGTLLKSNSFSTFNNKPKVKLVDDVNPHKQKGARELSSFDTKEGPLKKMSKSNSFKSSNSGRSSVAESKVKMLSPRFPHFQDVRGLKKAKERNTFERKNFSKSDRPNSSATVSSLVSSLKVDQKLTPRGESASNNRDLKSLQSDGKFTTSKPIGSLARKALEIPGTLGESKRLCSSAEEKLNHVSPKEEPSSCTSQITPRPLNSASGILLDGLPLSRESTNQAGENFLSRSRQGVTTGGRGVPCQRCKETSHATHSCTISSPRDSSVDASTARNPIDEINKGNKLKAAIHAAMLKKPGIYKKSRVRDQSDELSLSSMDLNCEVASQELLSVSSQWRNTISAEGKHEGQAIRRDNTSDSCKQTNINNVKQVTVHPAESIFSFKTWESDSAIHLDEKPNNRELHNSAPAAMSVFPQISPIPEYEYIWRGDFEVHRSGEVSELCAGIQAHLSTYASPRVLDVVNKFPFRISLTEVPRLGTWPTQFHDSGATEDHIALYFFAKDLDSYEKNYKSLLESMIKNDLALKGNVDGAELLIFPSNQLPERSQRWNMLFFLWGVFRARRVNCLDHIPNSSKKLDIPTSNAVTLGNDIPSAVMSYSENLCSLRHIDESSECDRIHNAVLLESNSPASFKSPETINGDLNSKVSSLEPLFSGFQAKSEHQDGRLDSHSLARIPRSSAQLCPELGYTHTSREAHSDPDCQLDVELQPMVQAARTTSNFNKGDKMPIHQIIVNDRRETLSPTKIHSIGPQEVVSMGIGEENKLARVNSSIDHIKIENNVKEEDTLMSDVSIKEPSSWPFSCRKRAHLDLTETSSQASSSCTNETMPRKDADNMLVGGETESKKQKTGSSEVYGCEIFRSKNALNDDDVAEQHDTGPSHSGKYKCDGVWDGTKTSKDLESAERHFFPVVSRPVMDLAVGDNSIPWRPVSSENKVWLHAGVSNRPDDDDVPNLELALGAEMKPPQPKYGILATSEKGSLPFFVGATVDKKKDQERPSDMLTIKKEEDNVSASLSLSLSFPFADKDLTVEAGPKTEPLLPERRHVNTSYLLFKGLSDK